MEDGSKDRVLQCANPDCKVPSGGRCIEGFPDASQCPQFGKSMVIIEATEAVITKSAAPGLRLPLGEALSLIEAESTVRQKPSNLISVVGPSDAGKTSLIAGIYDLLQTRPVGGYQFAGSSTLYAFERACHDSRRASERDEPHMDRTPLGDVSFFHMDLVESACSRRCTALLANRAGEHYMDTQSDQSLARGFPELKRSDTLTILADGMKLLTGERHHARRDVRLTLRAFNEAGVLLHGQRLAVVMTKLDAVRVDEVNGPDALRYFDEIVRDVSITFSSVFQEIRAFQVAASPKSDGASRGEGLVDLLQYWMAAPSRFSHHRDAPVTRLPSRSFGRLRPVNSEEAAQ
jgi:hypothetical protein